MPDGLDAADANADADPRVLYLVAEKIVAAHEAVPRDWAIHGTTGYRFSNLVNGLFVERRNAQRGAHLATSAARLSPSPMSCTAQRLVAYGALASQLTTLTHALQRIALADRHTRDYGFNTLRDALAEIAAAMPVYRTYIVEQASAQDRQYVDWAVAHARRRGHATPPALFDFLRSCLLAEPTPRMHAAQAEAVRAFAMSFQQFCAPLARQGHRGHRLLPPTACSLNEVGGDPDQFGLTVKAFHGASGDRSAHWPATMLAGSTHDNKRSEDVRARIDVLSEEPAAWRLALRRWKTQTRSWRCLVDGELAPSAADLVLLQQTLLGTLPAEGPSRRLEVIARIEAYMLKAAREAKRTPPPFHTRP
jgi:(1->4)-alpha-D-glucan 1-alpha-D-glucosylmutase